ncbi:fibrinogen-like protein A [Mytilus trossulus]|uniref:fibrinogen-like protein A n=1 Tax=Mytilus trossulus TaxID=6551 RepID=UPI003004006C
MRNMIRNSVQEELKDVLKTSLKEDSTKDLIRNITLHEMNDILEEQGRDELFHPVNNEEKRKLQYPKDCTTIHNHNPETTSGVQTIYPVDEKAERVYCDMETDRGGWTVIQRRIDGWSQFQRPWIDYENGFGTVDEEYWFGNKNIHSLTSSGNYELRIDLKDLSNTKKYAVYKTFVVGDAASKYKLTVGNYSGNAGDSMAIHNGMKFSTIDQDNDLDSGADCARPYGAWWHNHCGTSCLNRRFLSNLCWNTLKTYSAKTSVMMLRTL